jgi:hypothetical protein
VSCCCPLHRKPISITAYCSNVGALLSDRRSQWTNARPQETGTSRLQWASPRVPSLGRAEEYCCGYCQYSCSKLSKYPQHKHPSNTRHGHRVGFCAPNTSRRSTFHCDRREIRFLESYCSRIHETSTTKPCRSRFRSKDEPLRGRSPWHNGRWRSPGSPRDSSRLR